jgi:hypothetical protein
MNVTQRRPGPTWRADYMIRNPLGGAIAVDSDPTSVAPPASRIMTGPRGGFWATFTNSGAAALGPFLTMISVDGTAITVRWWWYDDRKALWVPGTTAVTLTTASSNFQQLRYNLGAKLFVQCTANTGVARVAIVFR